VLATITQQGRTIAHNATKALNQANFGLQALSRDETAYFTTMLRNVRIGVGDIPASASATETR